MSKLKQPIFEKPDEPDFIKRMKQTQFKEQDRNERPMTDAPAREDELPAVANEMSEAEREALRELHGLERTPAVTDNDADSNVIAELSFGMKSASKRPAIAALGQSNGEIRKRKKLDELRSKNEHQVDSVEKNSGITGSTGKAKTKRGNDQNNMHEPVDSALKKKRPTTSSSTKTKGRTKMSLSFED